MQIQVEVHQSSSNSQSPSLADATVSENESLTLSGLTTPDTPTPRLHYTPLTEDSLSDAVTTPEYHKLTPSPFTSPSTHFHLSNYENVPRDRLSYPGDHLTTHSGNVARDRLSFQGVLKNSDLGLKEKQYENTTKDTHMVDEVVRYGNLSGENYRLDSELGSTILSNVLNIQLDEAKYEEIKESSIYESLDDTKKDLNFYENVATPLDDDSELYEPVLRKDLDSSYEEISGRECLLSERLQRGGISSSGSLISPVGERHKENEYECLVGLDSSSEGIQDSNHNMPSPDPAEEHFYEDIQVRQFYFYRVS